MITFQILGVPVAKGRPRFTKRGIAYTPQKTRLAEQDFKIQALPYRPSKPIVGAISIRMRVYKPKPKSKSKKISQWITRPDLDNYIKTLDSLNGIFWIDDSQIVHFDVSKEYGEPARIELEIQEVE